MEPRLYLRTGEVPALFGLDTHKSEWALWNDLREAVDNGAGDYGKWQSRLMVPIMTGVAEDHGLKVEGALDPRGDDVSKTIMPPKAWRVAQSMRTNGRPSVLVVTQRGDATLREWKEPGTMPAKSLLRYEAIATAYGVDDVLVGVLVDGYSSRLYHVHTTSERRTQISERVAEFIENVAHDNEPEIDFGTDQRAIRSGIAVSKVEAAAETVEQMIGERTRLLAERAPADATLKRIDQRMRQIDNNLIHMAGQTGRIEVGTKIIVIERDAKNTPRVNIIDKGAAPLF